MGDCAADPGNGSSGVHCAVGELIIFYCGTLFEGHSDGDGLVLSSIRAPKCAGGGVVRTEGQRFAVHQPGKGHGLHGSRVGFIVGLGGNVRTGGGQGGLADGYIQCG